MDRDGILIWHVHVIPIVQREYKYSVITDFTLHPTMSEQALDSSPPSSHTEPQSVPPRKPTTSHPYRVYGYKVTQEWVYKFAKDHNIGQPDWKGGAIESAVLGYLVLRLPGFQLHFVDDPSDTVYGYRLCLGIATNWNRKKIERVAGRLPTWKAVLGTEEQPQWHMPTRCPVPLR